MLFRYAAKKIIEQEAQEQSFLPEKRYLIKLIIGKIQKMNLHTPEVSEFSAVIAKELKVRKIIKMFQKKYVKQKKTIVLEGRDMSKIFHNADVKFFVVCKPIKNSCKKAMVTIK